MSLPNQCNPGIHWPKPKRIFFTIWKCSLISHVWFFMTPWTVAYQPPLSIGILQTRILQWVAIPFSRGSSWPRERTWSLALQADSLRSEPPGTYSWLKNNPQTYTGAQLSRDNALKILVLGGGTFFWTTDPSVVNFQVGSNFSINAFMSPSCTLFHQSWGWESTGFRGGSVWTFFFFWSSNPASTRIFLSLY